MAPNAEKSAAMGATEMKRERKRAMMATIPPFMKSGQRFTATHRVKIKIRRMVRLQRKSEELLFCLESSFGQHLTCKVLALTECNSFCGVTQVFGETVNVTSGEYTFSPVDNFDSPAAMDVASSEAAKGRFQQGDSPAQEVGSRSPA